MGKIIKTNDLKIGMHIKIPISWYKHPFLRNRFQIVSTKQIKKLKAHGIRCVEIVDEINPKNFIERRELCKDNEVLPESNIDQNYQKNVEILKNTVHEKKLPYQQKAWDIYKISIEIMEQLRKSPTMENIQQFKEAATEIVDLILADDLFSDYLLQLTRYDYYTYTHSINVGFLAILLSKALFRNTSIHDLHELGAGFFLHDIGKVAIDENILNKPGKLSEAEMHEMRKHPEEGYKLLREANQLSHEAKIIVMQHHERFDGSGYPLGLKGPEIHVYGRICSIADVYGALTSRRPYKKKLKPFDALCLMKKEMMGQFQDNMFEQFILLFN